MSEIKGRVVIGTYKQMTLGEVIEKLSSMDPSTAIMGLGYLMSYRGYYDEISFLDHPENVLTVKDLLKMCQEALTKTFEGYKGGDYTMFTHTPVWVSDYGECPGKKLIGINKDGGYYLLEPAGGRND